MYCSAAMAKEPQPRPPGAPAARVELQFVSLAPIQQFSLLRADGGAIAIQAPPNQLSPIVKVPTMDEWALAEKVPDKGKFIAGLRTKALKSDHQILIISLDPKGALQLHAIEGSPNHFKPGCRTRGREVGREDPRQPRQLRRQEEVRNPRIQRLPIRRGTPTHPRTRPLDRAEAGLKIDD